MRSHFRVAVLAGLTGAFLIDAFLSLVILVGYHDDPVRLYHWDASNALGDAAFAGGWQTAVLGTAMHVVVSLCWAAVYVAGSLRFTVLRQRPLLAGAVFGLAVMLVMRYAIVPLGHAHQGATHVFSPAFLINVVAHTLFFGIPVALVVARYPRADSRAFRVAS